MLNVSLVFVFPHKLSRKDSHDASFITTLHRKTGSCTEDSNRIPFPLVRNFNPFNSNRTTGLHIYFYLRLSPSRRTSFAQLYRSILHTIHYQHSYTKYNSFFSSSISTHEIGPSNCVSAYIIP